MAAISQQLADITVLSIVVRILLSTCLLYTSDAADE